MNIGNIQAVYQAPRPRPRKAAAHEPQPVVAEVADVVAAERELAAVR